MNNRFQSSFVSILFSSFSLLLKACLLASIFFVASCDNSKKSTPVENTEEDLSPDIGGGAIVAGAAISVGDDQLADMLTTVALNGTIAKSINFGDISVEWSVTDAFTL
ncbi:MAG: hypothetical protein MI865_13375, partial [Proteobacteria bacterium]|nr:hypothetical protein [Pseudomonadota bacterium]